MIPVWMLILVALALGAAGGIAQAQRGSGPSAVGGARGGGGSEGGGTVRSGSIRYGAGQEGRGRVASPPRNESRGEYRERIDRERSAQRDWGRGERGGPDERGSRAGEHYRRFRYDYSHRPDHNGDDRHDSHRRHGYRYYRYNDHYYPLYLDPGIEWYYPDVYYYPEPLYLGSTATYEVVEPREREWIEGRYEEVAERESVPGETVEVYHPAVYRRAADGSLELLERGRVTREPKYRIVLNRVWVEGHYAGDEEADAGAAYGPGEPQGSEPEAGDRAPAPGTTPSLRESLLPSAIPPVTDSSSPRPRSSGSDAGAEVIIRPGDLTPR